MALHSRVLSCSSCGTSGCRLLTPAPRRCQPTIRRSEWCPPVRCHLHGRHADWHHSRASQVALLAYCLDRVVIVVVMMMVKRSVIHKYIVQYSVKENGGGGGEEWRLADMAAVLIECQIHVCGGLVARIHGQIERITSRVWSTAYPTPTPRLTTRVSRRTLAPTQSSNQSSRITRTTLGHMCNNAYASNLHCAR